MISYTTSGESERKRASERGQRTRASMAPSRAKPARLDSTRLDSRAVTCATVCVLGSCTDVVRLAPYRCKKIKMLEIGLGCDMHYG